MYLPPEVLALVASFLDTKSCLTCMSVSRYWNQVFIPCLWHTVKFSEQPWPRLFPVSCSTSRPPTQRQQHIVRSLTEKYGCHIRVLEMDTAWLLWGSMLGHVNSLLSMKFMRILPRFTKSNPPFEAYNIYSSDAIPYSVFDVQPSGYSSPNFKMTLACWHMVFNNKALQSLEFPHLAYNYFPLQIQDDDKDYAYDMTPEGKMFLIDILSRLPDLRHMSIGQHSDDFLGASLAEHFPKLTSFVHMGTNAFDPSIRPQSLRRHLSLQSLRFGDSEFPFLDAEHLRWIVTAFPGLHNLSIPGHFSRVHLGSLDDWDGIDNFSIKALSMYDFSYTATEVDLSVFEKARITFHAVKELQRTCDEYDSLGDLLRILRFFPALERFEFSRGAVFTSPLTDGGLIAGRESGYRFRTLQLGPEETLALASKEHLMSQSPFLTRVEMHHVSPSVLLALADSCGTLEYVHISLDGPCSLELNQLLVKCSRLKECTGCYHLVSAVDILRSPNWTCLGLRELDIMVVNVPRVKGKRERKLERAKRTLEKSGGEGMQELNQEIYEQQLHLNPQPKSQRCQGKVFSKLARLSQLEKIDLRYRPSEKQDIEEIYLCTHSAPLEFTLEVGFEQLGVLDHLRVIRFGVGGGKVGQKERDWLWRRWSMKQKPGEKGVFCVEDLM
ncbi:hypothetical protein BGZ96_003964 [Linnemannia gamsii]|uniref:F-box domain-containing protein n=1 Tax=Linnemannia gamsii TaxID=64522 RepID=A0ABQ7K6Z9_9FUNG|nr:hypothetical protein BGZ96_003964 [Linnemannia gamsii]